VDIDVVGSDKKETVAQSSHSAPSEKSVVVSTTSIKKEESDHFIEIKTNGGMRKVFASPAVRYLAKKKKILHYLKSLGLAKMVELLKEIYCNILNNQNRKTYSLLQLLLP